MSDPGRKDLDTKVKEKIVPDSMKSDTQKIKEATTTTADKAAREIQPDHHKSTTQDTTDKIGRSHDNTVHGSTHASVGEKIKEALHMEKDHLSHNTAHTDVSTNTGAGRAPTI